MTELWTPEERKENLLFIYKSILEEITGACLDRVDWQDYLRDFLPFKSDNPEEEERESWKSAEGHNGPFLMSKFKGKGTVDTLYDLYPFPNTDPYRPEGVGIWFVYYDEAQPFEEMDFDKRTIFGREHFSGRDPEVMVYVWEEKQYGMGMSRSESRRGYVGTLQHIQQQRWLGWGDVEDENDWTCPRKKYDGEWLEIGDGYKTNLRKDFTNRSYQEIITKKDSRKAQEKFDSIVKQILFLIKERQNANILSPGQ